MINDLKIYGTNGHQNTRKYENINDKTQSGGQSSGANQGAGAVAQ